jgi:hypothetical protein
MENSKSENNAAFTASDMSFGGAGSKRHSSANKVEEVSLMQADINLQPEE